MAMYHQHPPLSLVTPLNSTASGQHTRLQQRFLFASCMVLGQVDLNDGTTAPPPLTTLYVKL